MTELVLIFACALVGLNVTATLAVARKTLSAPRQKFLQLALIWVLPILGAVLALAVFTPPDATPRCFREPLDADDDFASEESR